MRAEYIRLQEEQPSYFSPHYSEFSRFTDGLKHISSPRCLPPVSPDDTTKIDNNFESCTIVSCFFVFSANMKKDELKQEVERVVGHELREARDFELLSQLIFKGTREQLSPTTLKRLWGYLKNEEVQTRQHTLDVLARFAGYRSYEDFCTHPDNKEDVQSGICIEERVSTEKMRLGQRLIITWLPDRRIVVRHLGYVAGQRDGVTIQVCD